MLRFTLFMLMFPLVVAFGQTAEQNRFQMDRYDLAAQGINQVRLNFKNENFAFNRISIETGLAAVVVIEAIVIRTGSGDKDLWLTKDSALFYSNKNSQTALIRTAEKSLIIELSGDVIAGDQIRILFNFSINKYNVSSRPIGDNLLTLILSHTSFAGRLQQLLPAQPLTIKS